MVFCANSFLFLIPSPEVLFYALSRPFKQEKYKFIIRGANNVQKVKQVENKQFKEVPTMYKCKLLEYSHPSL